MNRTDIQADVVSRILEALESGQLFWRKPWSVHKNAGPLAYSMSSGKPYQGINSLILMCARWKFGWESKWFGTFNQIKTKGGSVLKGAKATRVILFKPLTEGFYPQAGRDRKATNIVRLSAGLRSHEISQCIIRVPLRLFYLLAQSVKD